jgi:outer membrane protein assembly factor BamB
MKFSCVLLKPILARLSVGFWTVCVGCLFCVQAEQSIGQIITDETLSQAGLEVHWEGSLGGAGLSRAEQNMAVWAHSTDRREYVDVFLGNRLIERIDARQIDRVALDRLIMEGKPTKPAPKLGMQGAKDRAEKLVKTYAIVGRQLTVKTFSEPVIYVVTLASNGILTAFDGESGEILWQNSMPFLELQVLGPGVSDDFVAVVNGNHYFVFSMKDGNLISTRVLEYTPTSAPVPIQSKIMVPSVGGRLVAYDINSPLLTPVILRGGRDNLNGTALSADHNFLAWSSQKSMFLATDEKIPTMWAKVNANDDVQSRPVPTPSGFLFASNNGTIIHSSLQRTGTFLWRANVSLQTGRSPVVGNDRVFIVSDDGQVMCLDLQSGDPLWGTTTKNIDSVLGVGKEHIYAKNTSGLLQSIRISDGKVDGRTSTFIPTVVPNSVHDRFFVVTRNGHLTCLREKGAVMPTLWIRYTGKPEANTQQSKASAAPAPPASAPSEDDPFGDDAKPGAGGNDAKDPFDPF